jgi:chalcone isomerase-like protein
MNSIKKGDRMNRIILTIAVLVLFSSILFGLEIGKVNLPDEMSLENDTIVLNGAGLRKKLIIKVYAAGLYLTQKNSNAEKIMEADEAIAIRMHFIYKKVSEKKLIAAWNEGFLLSGLQEGLAEKIAQFNSFFTEAAKKGDIYDIIYEPGIGTSVYIKGELKGTIPGLDFKKAVYSIWLGENTALPKLREQLLGN